MRLPLLVLVLPLALTGCATRPEAPAEPRSSVASVPSDTPAPTPSEASSQTPSQPVDPSVAKAVADLVTRANVTEAEVKVVSVDNVTWRNSAMGCPQPGMNYLQALYSGVRIVLEATGQRFEYHAGGKRDAFYCEDPEPPLG